MRFGIVRWELLRKTLNDRAVVEGIAAIAENAGAWLFATPWQRKHVASANRRPETGSPSCWLKARLTPARMNDALSRSE
jgi:hypothetical protein